MSGGGTASLAWRLARRELRGGIRGLRVFLACLVLGVGAIAGIGSLAAAVTAGIAGNARELLGGDVEAELAYRPAAAAERAWLAGSGRMSVVAELRAMALSPDGARHSLIELTAVDPAYPLYGTVALSPPQPLERAFGVSDGVFGAAVDPAILGRLGLQLGDRFRIGEAVLQVRAAIAHQPDAVAGGFILGPRVMISAAALAATRLIQPGALVAYRYRIALPPRTDPALWARAARTAFPEAGWQIRTSAAAAPGLRQLVDRVALYLSLVGLTALLVGGVGIGNAVAFHLAGKTATIATLKCLGASNRLVVAAYFAEIIVLALLGIAVGLGLGGLLPAAAMPLLGAALPVAVRPGLYPQALALAALYGLLTTLLFSLWPLAGIMRIPAGALFRDQVDRARRRPPLPALAATAALGLALAGLAIAGAGDRRTASWFVVGALAAFALLGAAGTAITCIAKRLGRPRRPVWRMAIANLHRPGAPTRAIVLSLGIGLTVLVAAALVEGNLAREVETRLPGTAPAVFFIDIQPAQLAPFEAIVHATPEARLEQVPMMRGRITRLNGVPVETAAVMPEARWALRGDRGLTYAATMPPGSKLAAGEWWPRDYRGPPLMSFDAGLAHDMALEVGDTVTVNLLGREITARIANLREIDWRRLGINFVMVFAPGTLERAPQTHLAAVWLPAERQEPLIRRVTRTFANVTAIPVGEILAAVDRVIGMIGDAIRLTALLTLAVGALVLGGAVAAGRHRRVYDAVVLKVLGATRGAVLAIVLIENGLLGALSAAVAAALGTLAAYFVVTRLMGSEWVFLPWPLLTTAVAATLLAMALGLAGTWRALGAKPAPYLRHE